ncbi:LPXTG cell wall anchor domain-containing protein [Alkalibacillus haloalkaliphilus]|uniref:LPXTG cell wall anchor domain-containing protein n=1 Tax=Alkalibacillus haloalkaliphilus TaxID=94136 RepID=UPI00293550C2|nr:LPXTG cell wall anchor domain-containing protein [Alkalibacillus haloalkaliphilus]MDV2581278.1 LPXTG cell wall anchor domain-containing protein [Alkalibacillus haloalkaliphilus]
MSKMIRFSVSTLIVIALLLFLSVQTAADEDQNLIEFDDEGFFQVTNFAPGQTEESTVSVLNIADSSIEYAVTLDYDGDENFYEQLLVNMYVEEELIYEGSFSGLEEITAGELAEGEEVPLTLSVHFPKESGNKYQGNNMNFVLTAHAEEIVEEEVASGVLPQTGEGIPYLFYIGGALLLLIGVALLFSKKRPKTVVEG